MDFFLLVVSCISSPRHFFISYCRRTSETPQNLDPSWALRNHQGTEPFQKTLESVQVCTLHFPHQKLTPPPQVPQGKEHNAHKHCLISTDIPYYSAVSSEGLGIYLPPRMVSGSHNILPKVPHSTFKSLRIGNRIMC